MGGLFVLLISCAVYAGNIPTTNTIYPIGPAPELTEGSVCKRPTTFRYPEHIAYCERKVSSSAKDRIIDLYNSRLGYHIQNRKIDYKIDHFYPLCAGGSNEADNLWPQHKSVYVLTDPLEQLVCEKMAQGHLQQKDALGLIRKAKLNLSEVARVLAYVRAL
jgi:hypothetical protein